jgi:beta-N-acetylhexosaminidase
MTRSRRMLPLLRLRPLVALLALAVLGAGCIPGSAARSGSTAGAASPVRTSTAGKSQTPAATVASTGTPRPKPTASASGPSARTPAPTSVPTTATQPSAEPSTGPSTGPDTQGSPTLAQLVGQRLVIRMAGTTPSADLLGRIRRGEIGGVILFGANIVDATQVRALTAQLHGAAAAGGQPRLLVMTDQEGGLIRRIPWVGPVPSARQMAAGDSLATIRTRGTRTGTALDGLGIDVDLAPVADVPKTTSSFMWLDHRTFGFEPTTVSPDANAFALGLRDGHTAATMKHFPGIGRATRNTDDYAVTIPANVAAIQRRDLVPYTAAIANRVPLIMLSNANYTALDPVNGAGWSRAITRTLLRDQLGFRGVTITDSLSTAAQSRAIEVGALTVRAAVAGTDFLLVPTSEAKSAAVYQKLLAAAEAGTIPLTRLQASYRRITTLKAGQ